MKILALMMFLASTLAFSHPADPADLANSASPACQEIASSVVECGETYASYRKRKASLCTELGNGYRTCKLPMLTFPACSVSSLMDDYLLCEISEIKAQTVDRLSLIRKVLSGLSHQFLIQSSPSYLLYKYLKKKAEQEEIEE